MAAPWLSPRLKKKSRIPRLDPVCGRPFSAETDTIRIMGIENDTILRPPGSRSRLPALALQAQGGDGLLYWLLNSELIAEMPAGTTGVYNFDHPGRYVV